MKQFKDIITLARNSRGCFILDTIKGCSGVSSDRPRGCYGDCYANNIASRYRIDFTSPIKRDFVKDKIQLRLFDFDDARHTKDITNAISKIDMPFVRIGEMGDPSEDWEHTINICNIIRAAGKRIVIITKHWHPIHYKLLSLLSGLYINTSISALDTDEEIEYRLSQFNRLKPYCNSTLRVVSCDFNQQSEEGKRRLIIQDRLFENIPIIDTVFRPIASNQYLANGVIFAERVKFLGAYMLASMRNKSAFLGYCKDCPDMCGLALDSAKRG
jgi:hypothetical protein